MAESIETIKERIAGDYNDLSKVSILRHLQDVVAIAYKLLTEIFDAHIIAVNTAIEASVPGTKGWYRDQLLKFQYGYDLELIDYRPAYSEEDIDAQIIEYVHVTERLGGIIAKVAKADRTELLTTEERNALLSYISKIKHPGTAVLLVNQPADEISLEMTVTVNKEIINTNGQLIANTYIYPVKDAILEFVNAGEFGGIINVDALVEYIRSEEGILHVNLELLTAHTHTLVDTVIYDFSNEINLLEYESEAGHVSLDESDLTITYI
jgi:hypothetical protein